MIAGWAAPILIGTPRQVAEQMAEYAAAGIEGIMLEWYDYHDGLQYFGEKILPILEAMGLRAPTVRS
jgi:FMNH2-dependent dimethyl sulfone monooxygenase